MENNMKSQTEQLERLNTIAYLDIPIEKTSPTYRIFEARKITAQKFKDSGNEVYLEIVEHYNDLIKKYLGIW
jgi:hypothetical protein